MQLTLKLVPEATVATVELHFKRSSEGAFYLNGESQLFQQALLDGRVLAPQEFAVDSKGFTLLIPPEQGVLTIQSQYAPASNTELEGLYVTNGTFCTQCEAEGFRRITYYPDRPDVMSIFTVVLQAPKAAYPTLLANGNLISQRDLADGWHEAVWHDPHRKPAYLFACVAGDLAVLPDHFTTQSGRQVLLEIYAKPHNLKQADFAMQSLKRSMRWDEVHYGREYDLDRFMIYCADDFNMGAMENKGLNIFNSRFVLGTAKTATDTDLHLIDAVVAHEYFHNWSGNRVTCRDWFQLSLKEGFTVYRDQSYSATYGSAAVVRVDEVNFLQQYQFAEDAGPQAHPVRPEQYQEINNFYTVTVYEKGAEVIRMLHTLLGDAAYRQGCDTYFEQHDGTAATCDDFVAALQSAAPQTDLTQFKLWYSQAGTPRLQVSSSFDASTKRYSLHCEQSLADTPGQSHKLPMVIPIRMGLLSQTGEAISGSERVLVMTEAKQSYHFEGLEAEPIPSLLRGLSAPVTLATSSTDAQLLVLAKHDSDAVSRWNATQTLAHKAIAAQPGALVNLLDLYGYLLQDRHSDPALLAYLLALPDASNVALREQAAVDPQTIAARIDVVEQAILKQCQALLEAAYQRTQAEKTYAYETSEIARRALNQRLLAWLAISGSETAQSQAAEQYTKADNMTDQMAALTAVNNTASATREQLMAHFAHAWQHDPLIMNKWFALQAQSQLANATSVKQLMQHPAYDAANPNKIRAVVGGLSMRNWTGFHALDGSGYRFLAEQVIALDASNPQIAARMVDGFSRWAKFAEPARDLQQAALEQIKSAAQSANVLELVNKSLQSGQA
jgi:aminopeptidase N